MKSKWFLIWLLLLFFFPLSLAACSVNTAHAPEVEPVQTTTAVPTPTFSPNTAVIFKRTGGLTGINEEWVIFTDGRIQTNSAIQPQLSADDVSQLLGSLESAGFFDLNSTYLPEDTCCDRILYEITAVQDTSFHTVTTLEATPDMPETLQQSLRLIETILFSQSDQ